MASPSARAVRLATIQLLMRVNACSPPDARAFLRGDGGDRGAPMSMSGLRCVESCLNCDLRSSNFFCDLSLESIEAFNKIKHAAVFPEHAVVLVEGQNPWGIFILCQGRVKLSTTSREGKTLIVRIADAPRTIRAKTFIECLSLGRKSPQKRLSVNHGSMPAAGPHSLQCCSSDASSSILGVPYGQKPAGINPRQTHIFNQLNVAEQHGWNLSFSAMQDSAYPMPHPRGRRSAPAFRGSSKASTPTVFASPVQVASVNPVKIWPMESMAASHASIRNWSDF